MPPSRQLVVELIGDSRSLERAYARAAKAGQRFHQQVAGPGGSAMVGQWRQQVAEIQRVTAAERALNGVRLKARKALGIGPFRVAGVGLGAGLGLFAATQAARELGKRLETTGEAAFTAGGRIKNMVASLTGGNLVGAFEALTTARKTMEDFGWQLYEVKQRQDALKQVASGTAAGIRDQSAAFSNATFTTTLSADAMARFRDVTDEAGTSSQEAAQKLLKQKEAMEQAAFATENLTDWTARLNQEFVTQSGIIATFKGSPDDLLRGVRREPVGRRQVMPGSPKNLPALSPSQRRELDLIGKEGIERVSQLQDRLRQLNNQIKAGNIDQEQRLRILTNIRNTEAEIADIYAAQAAARKAAAEEAKREAEAAKQKRLALAEQIKAAVLDRLNRRETAVNNQRALADAKEQLRLARMVGGPMGIKVAQRRIQDVGFDIQRARLERMPATLTAGGRFALGGLVININGVTDPEAVARRVTEILKRRQRQTTTQTRGKAAGATA